MEQSIRNKTIELRHELHQHPELSMQEQDTMNRIIRVFSSEDNLVIERFPHWFYAYYQCGHPDAGTIAFRADMDALPIMEDNELPYCSVNLGVSHRCGHDGHSAVLAGLALSIAKFGAKKNIYFIFQHAEEIGAGAIECAKLIADKKIEEIYAFHNWSGFPLNSIVIKPDIVQCASKGYTIRMVGKSAHASRPEDGINPSAAIAKLSLMISKIAGWADYRGMVLATIVGIKVGDKNFGIAASDGELSVTLRSYYEEDLNLLQKRLNEQALMLASEYRLDITFDECDVFPDTVNDANLTEKVIEIARNLGKEVVLMEQPFRSSEDFGYYQKQCPGVMFYVGNGEDYPQIHTTQYDFNDNIIENTIDLFYTIANKE